MRWRGLATAALIALGPASASADDAARQRTEAAAVTITRDDWGVAHVRAATDAQAVFGMTYAQAEDDFARIEANYLTALGRTAEDGGEAALWQDLRQRLFIDPLVLRTQYAASPLWLRRLMDAWADGLNYYLLTNPRARPRVIRRFLPWMALSFSEGSIGGDIERIGLSPLASFYGGALRATNDQPPSGEPTGSNGIAIAPRNTRDGHALLLINPHTSFYFRAEQQVTSEEGLNAYGAATWGQFFIYQGFNPHAGWMHTSSGVDVVDEFAETIVRRRGRLYYRYGQRLRPVEERRIVLSYRAPDGALRSRAFSIYRTHHGPIVRAERGRWVAVALMNRPLAALEQSFLRTKAVNYAQFLQIAGLQANSSNNTIFADDKGEIAYLHPSFIPRRDDRFDYSLPVDGSDPETDWRGLHAVSDAPHVLDPRVGWVFNTNNWPFSAAGPDSPRQSAFPRYMDTFGENTRGLHALRLLTGRTDFTLEGLMAAAYDPYLPAFARLVPALITAYDRLPRNDPSRTALAGQIAVLRRWDFRWAPGSVATSLAVFWGEDLWRSAGVQPDKRNLAVYDFLANSTSDETKLRALTSASDRLTSSFGDWRTPWGEINRFQRIDDSLVGHFSDQDPSIAVPFTSSQWGSLASFSAKAYPGTKRYYGSSGNSFVAVVEFGARVRAKAITAGGESGDPASPHFADQASRYAVGALRDVYFWPDQLACHTERIYHPGE